jgi:hypothetical protein
MFERGNLVLGSFRGARIRLHWTVLLGVLIFSGFHPSFGFLLAYPVLIFVHELGHALLVARFGHRVVGIELTGAGGECQWSGNSSPFEESVIAWGGVLAQSLLLALSLLWSWRVPVRSSALNWQVVSVFTHTNSYLMILNLIPVAPLDGARAWHIVTAWNERGQKGVPYGTWRGASPDAQRAWFDGVTQRAQKRQGTPHPSSASNVHPSEEGTLEPKNQRAIDDLLRRTTGKVRRIDKRGP